MVITRSWYDWNSSSILGVSLQIKTDTYMSYRQCELKREENGCKVTTVAYIPSKLAKVGRNIEINENEVWTAWTVSTASSVEISDELAKQVRVRLPLLFCPDNTIGSVLVS